MLHGEGGPHRSRKSPWLTQLHAAPQRSPGPQQTCPGTGRCGSTSAVSPRPPLPPTDHRQTELLPLPCCLGARRLSPASPCWASGYGTPSQCKLRRNMGSPLNLTVPTSLTRHLQKTGTTRTGGALSTVRACIAHSKHVGSSPSRLPDKTPVRSRRVPGPRGEWQECWCG